MNNQWNPDETCGTCQAFIKDTTPQNGPGGGACRKHPPTPMSAYGSEYPVTKDTRECCMEWVKSAAALATADYEMLAEMSTLSPTTLTEPTQDFIIEHDHASCVHGHLVCDLHPKRTGKGKVKPRVSCDTCLAIWEFNKKADFMKLKKGI